MKILHISRSKILLLYISFLILPLFSSGQDLGSVIFGKKSKTNYLGQYTDNHKMKNGMGILRFKNGDIYIGDFVQNKQAGKGMLISTKGIANAPEAVVYVGGWRDGKKQGKGTCYAANGDIIYRGKFTEDRPAENYPTENPDDIDYFTMKTIGEELYWGEVTQGEPNGFGIIVQENGSFWFGTNKSGERDGICMTVFGEDAWEVGVYDMGEYHSFNDFKTVAARQEYSLEIREIRREIKKELMNELLDIALGMTQLGIETMQMIQENRNAGSSYSGDNDDSGSSSGKNRNSSASSSKKSDCGTAWMTESRAYSDYESQLIRNAGSLSESDISNIKSKMRSIRQKWEKRGCPITKSQYE